MSEFFKEMEKYFVNARKNELKAFALEDFDQWLRQQIKYNSENYTAEQLSTLVMVREKLNEEVIYGGEVDEL